MIEKYSFGKNVINGFMIGDRMDTDIVGGWNPG